MSIRGNGERNLLIGFIVFIVIVSIWSEDWLRAISIFGAWSIFYFTCVWIKKIEINEGQIIIKRFMRQVVINTGTITDVDIRRHTIIIYSGRYSALNFYKYQIQKEDLPKLIEHLSKYTYSK